MRRLVTAPLHLVLWALLLLTLPLVWLVGLVHGLLTVWAPRRPSTSPPQATAAPVPPTSLSDAVVRDLFTVHEAALREGKRPWH